MHKNELIYLIAMPMREDPCRYLSVVLKEASESFEQHWYPEALVPPCKLSYKFNQYKSNKITKQLQVK